MRIGRFDARDLGLVGYADGYDAQLRAHAEVLAGRNADASPAGVLLTLQHPPVITVTKKAAAAGHVLASPEQLAADGIELAQTDRGGDVTYHGPGQLVCYPVVDLKRLGLGLHEYIRALESAVIETIAAFGIEGRRDPGATGVWVGKGPGFAKVCAIGVRVRRWVTLHGLALNVDPDMTHFERIVPCGLAGRRVTSVRQLTGDVGPSIDEVASLLVPAVGAALARVGVASGDDLPG